MKILLVDDHEIVRDGLQGLLVREPGWEVVGSCGSGSEAKRVALRARPDAAVLDFRLPDVRGEQLCRDLLAMDPGLRVVMLTAQVGEGVRRGVFEAGAAAYVAKSAGFGEVKRVLGEVAAGAGGIEVSGLNKDAGSSHDDADLTEQDRRLLELAAKGLSDRDIAEALFLAQSTVRFHIQKLKGRLGASSKTGLVATAIRRGHISMVEHEVQA